MDSDFQYTGSALGQLKNPCADTTGSSGRRLTTDDATEQRLQGHRPASFGECKWGATRNYLSWTRTGIAGTIRSIARNFLYVPKTIRAATRKTDKR
jgi:hypothetical protein